MKIKNFNELAVTYLRQKALQIVEVGLEAIDTISAIKEKVKIDSSNLIIGGEKFSLADTKRIFVAGAGKCAYDAAYALEEILGDKIYDGLVIDVRGGTLDKIRVLRGDHPMPTERNVEATKKLIHFLSGLSATDLVIFVISGGGSTMLSRPTNLTFEEEAKILKALFRKGADIKKINTIRKHLSLARGGYLAKYAYPAKVVSLVFSDVLGDDIGFVASGPTAKDDTTVSDAEKILKEYNLAQEAGIGRVDLIETPKENKYFENVKNILFVSNKTAIEAMTEAAKGLGFGAKQCVDCLTGEAREMGRKIVEELNAAEPGTAFIYGGETTVTIKHPEHRGGRNQEVALAALALIKENEIIIPFASDGLDNSDVAGGICDIITKNKAEELGLDLEKYLDDNASRDFFDKVGGYLLTGDTGSNVSDLLLAIKE